MKLREKIYLWWVKVLMRYKATGEVVKHLNNVGADEVKEGRVYEHFGRFLLAKKYEGEVEVTYTITPCTNMNPRATDLLKKHISEFRIAEKSYVTTNRKVGEEFMKLEKGFGVEVMAEVTKPACGSCDLDKMGIPCPMCEHKHVFRYLGEHRQNGTDQNAWLRMQEQRLGL